MTKESCLQEELTIFNVYVPNNSASKQTRQNLKELQEGIDKSPTRRRQLPSLSN